MNKMECKAIINNAPEDPERWIVARLVDRELWFYGSWDEESRADEIAEALGENAVVVEKGVLYEFF